MLRHGLYWEFPLNSDIFQTNNAAIGFPGVYEGLEIQTSLVTLNFNISPGRALLNNGVVVWNDEVMSNAGGLAPNVAANPRIDLIVIEYIHGSDATINRPRIKVVQGDAAVTPVAPAANANQIALGTIYMPAGANDLSDTGVVITNAQRVMYLIPGGFSVKPEVSTQFDALYDRDLKALVFESDFRVSTKIPGSLKFTAAKMAMEGIYWGNFYLTHGSFNDSNQPLSTTVELKNEAGAIIETITIASAYDLNSRLTTRTFTSTDFILTETFTYDPLNSEKAPNISQVISNV